MIPKTGIRLQFWVRGRRTVWPRVPLTELSDLPPYLDGRAPVKKALEAALEASSGANSPGILPASGPGQGVFSPRHPETGCGGGKTAGKSFGS